MAAKKSNPRQQARAGRARPSNVTDRVNRIDDWISNRLEELRQADERIGVRMEKMQRLETSLGRLSEVLRVQVEEVKLTGRQIAQFRQRMQYDIDELFEIARVRLGQIENPAREKLVGMQKDLEDLLQQAQAYIRKMDQPLRQHLEQMQRAEQNLSQRSEAILAETIPIKESVKQEFKQLVENVSQQIDAMDNPMIEKAPARAEQIEVPPRGAVYRLGQMGAERAEQFGVARQDEPARKVHDKVEPEGDSGGEQLDQAA